MRSVVTGGCGFIGSHVVDRLVQRGDEVVVVDDLATGDAGNLNPDARLVRGSVLDAEMLRDAVEGADMVFHLAALPRVERSVEDPVGTHRVNVDGTLNVLEAARLADVGRVVYASSSSVYGEQTTHLMREDMTPNPLSPYALQKLIAEQYLSMFAPVYGITAVSLRYFNVYGPGQPLEGEYTLVIGKFLRTRRAGRPLTVYGDGEQTRAYSHVPRRRLGDSSRRRGGRPAGPEHGAQRRLRRGDVGQPASRHDRWRGRPRHPEPQGRRGGAPQGCRLLAGRGGARLGADDRPRGGPESADGRNIQAWIPACAGMTVLYQFVLRTP